MKMTTRKTKINFTVCLAKLLAACVRVRECADLAERTHIHLTLLVQLMNWHIKKKTPHNGRHIHRPIDNIFILASVSISTWNWNDCCCFRCRCIAPNRLWSETAAAVPNCRSLPNTSASLCERCSAIVCYINTYFVHMRFAMIFSLAFSLTCD